jgi:putative pyruvate formate lyase activating enzyme
MPRQKNQQTPAYLKIPPAERQKRIAILSEIMSSCAFCPRCCGVNRREGERGRCGAAADLIISTSGPHFGEEKELVGTGGSGTIFFINCNLECTFCQNWTISRGIESGQNINYEELAGIMLSLQRLGCSNINLVSPTPYLYHIAAAIDHAASAGLRLPVVYNCGGYESVESLRLLDGFIDIYMPDAKYGSDSVGEIYSCVKDYFTRLKTALKEMQRQVGDLQIGGGNLAYRGLLVRHLVLPENMAGSEDIARFISEEISANCAVNVMAQYYPAYRADEFPALKRRITSAEYTSARKAFADKSLRLL